MILDKVNNPSDLKEFDNRQLTILASEVRDAIINRVSKIGGHIGPNLGMVELTVAIHRVFDSPKDKIVFDVSHQCYAHKILTGRKKAFLYEENFKDCNGFTNIHESKHDIFSIGHTSTSISLALGLAKARDMKGDKENIIAVIGDGSLSGGQAFEALDYAGEYDNNLIIIVNDNDQSIAENHGGLYSNLAKLRETNGKYHNNFFKTLGLEYYYLDDGHNIEKLLNLLTSVKDCNHPVVLHIHTIKGKGLSYAEDEREKYHQGGPFDVQTGEFYDKTSKIQVLTNSLLKIMDEKNNVVVINAATPGRLGLSKNIREKYQKEGKFIDVGIAEENAMAYASGIAKNGCIPVFATLSTFLQRTYDQFISDVCLNDSNAVILTLQSGIYGLNSATHLSLWDIQMFSHVPNATYLTPAYEEEYLAMLEYAISNNKHPLVIRVPNLMPKLGYKDLTDYSKPTNIITNHGKNVAIIGVSNMHVRALEVAKAYKEEYGDDITVINPRFVSGIDRNMLEKLMSHHHMIITLEDALVEGGYGQMISSFYADKEMIVKNLGISKCFHSEFNVEEILEKHGMDVQSLLELVREYYNK